MKPSWVAVAAIGLLLSACGPEIIVDPPLGLPCKAGSPVSAAVSPISVSLYPEETVQATYEILDCQGRNVLEVNPQWQTADANVATVDGNGLITAGLVGGPTTITVSEDQYGTSAKIIVNVYIVEPTP